jgi:hypothetical protein
MTQLPYTPAMTWLCAICLLDFRTGERDLRLERGDMLCASNLMKSEKRGIKNEHRERTRVRIILSQNGATRFGG